MTRVSRALVVLSLGAAAACGGSHAPTDGGGVGTAAGPPGQQTFTIHGTDRQQFSPQTVQAKVGTLTLTLQNGGVPHDLTFKTPGLPGISVVSGSATKSTTLHLTAPGTYVFLCTIHPGMDGKLVVSS
jgi:plastocyanin